MQNENISNDMEHRSLLARAEKLAEQMLKGKNGQWMELYGLKQGYMERAYVMLYLAKKVLALLPQGGRYKAQILSDCKEIIFLRKQPSDLLPYSEEIENFVRKMQTSPMEVTNAVGEKIRVPVKLSLNKRYCDSVPYISSYIMTVGDILAPSGEAKLDERLFFFQNAPSELGACENLIAEYHRAGMRTEELMVSLWRANILRSIENDEKGREISRTVMWLLAVSLVFGISSYSSLVNGAERAAIIYLILMAVVYIGLTLYMTYIFLRALHRAAK